MTGGVVVVVVVEVVVAAEIKNVLFVLPLKQIILKIIFYTKFKVNFLRLNSGELKSHEEKFPEFYFAPVLRVKISSKLV